MVLYSTFPNLFSSSTFNFSVLYYHKEKVVVRIYISVLSASHKYLNISKSSINIKLFCSKVGYDSLILENKRLKISYLVFQYQQCKKSWVFFRKWGLCCFDELLMKPSR